MPRPSAAALLLATGIPPADPIHGWIVTLEHELLPAIAGLARWTDRLQGKPR
jgi:hypothetical protein